MFLDVGNQQRIDDPTPEQVRGALRRLPADAPFLVINADDDQFIQATPQQADWRVEWRQEREHRFMITTLPLAEEALDAFLRWDEPALRAMPWKRLTVWNDPYRRLVFVAAGLVLLAVASLWSALR